MRPEEQSLWNSSAVPELMSEEEDGFRNGEPVWIVTPPAGRSPALSLLCKQLQERKRPGPRAKPRVLCDPELEKPDMDEHNEDDSSFTLMQL